MNFEIKNLSCIFAQEIKLGTIFEERKLKNNLYIYMESITKENVDYNKIYKFTKDSQIVYSLNGIRVLYTPHVKEIYNDIINDNVKCMAPIEVNINTMGVIDGQHRLQAAMNAWDNGYDFEIEVIFRNITKEEEAEIVVKKNTSQKSWTQKDFKHKLLLEGNKSAKRLNDFCLSHDKLHGKQKPDGTIPTKDRYAMALLRGQNITKEIIDGTVNITDEDVEFGEQLYKEAMHLYDILGYQSMGGGWFEYFLQGWYDFRSNNKYCKRLDKFGIDKYYDAVTKEFDSEKIMSKVGYTDKFVYVLSRLESERRAA